MTIEERFWLKVDQSAGLDACWPWTGYIRPNGYGEIWNCTVQRPCLSHRTAYELQVGPIPDGLVIDHLCRNRACQNAKHMETVTNTENVRRGVAAQQWRDKTHCPQGHEYAGSNLIVSKGKGGGTHRQCRACHNARDRAHSRLYAGVG